MIAKLKSIPNTIIARQFYSTKTSHQGADRKLYLEDPKGNKISFWHNIDLFTKQTDVFRCGIEIPKFSLAKMEVSKEIPFNPIIQDKKKVANELEPRFYAQFPIFNYGFLPQTWENSFQQNPEIDNLLVMIFFLC